MQTNFLKDLNSFAYSADSISMDIVALVNERCNNGF